MLRSPIPEVIKIEIPAPLQLQTMRQNENSQDNWS